MSARPPSPQPRPFASFGSEKMIYDIRMGPQGLFHDGTFTLVYPANRRGGVGAHPHLIQRDPAGRWSKARSLGRVNANDHHLCPVIWVDARGHFHVLYHAHIHLNQSRHLVSSAPLDPAQWEEAPSLAPSMSYPRLLTCPDGRRVLYYRVFGHMGYWTYRISHDGNHWEPPAPPLVDFDRDPQIPGDDWAGSYHSVALDRKGGGLHIALVRWDERHRVNPLYKRYLPLWNRHDLYYMKLDLRTGRIFNIEGERLPRPLTRGLAREKCLVWDTGEQITNMPSILVDPQDRPQFLFPVAGRRTDDCRFWFLRREAGEWSRVPVCATDNIWNGSHLESGPEGRLTAFLIGRTPGHGELFYGGGQLEEWQSTDQGRRWLKVADFEMPTGFFVNNPKPVEDLCGRNLPRTLLCFGWKGPEAIAPDGPFTGNAFLWQDGKWL